MGQDAEPVVLREAEASERRLSSLLRSRPGDGALNASMGEVQVVLGRPERAAFFFGRAWSVTPGDAGLAKRYMTALSEIGDWKEAQRVASRSVRETPGDNELRWVAAQVCVLTRKFREAERLLLPLADQPGVPANVRAEYLHRVLACGEASRCLALARSATAEHPGDVGVARLGAYASNYVDGIAPGAVLDLHREFGAACAARAVGGGLPRRTADRARVRVGLLGAEFRLGPVARFTVGLMDAIDQDRFDVHCYYTARADDAVTAFFRGRAAGFRLVDPADPAGLAAAVRGDAPDILVDLAGLSAGAAPTALAGRLAPVQITAVGYPNTTGIPAVDARIVDARTDPGGAEELATEDLIRLDPCFLCFRVPEEAPDPGPPPSASKGYVTFGSFNTLAKISERCLKAWAAVLRGVPRSRMVIKNLSLSDEELRQELFTRFAGEGVDPARLTLLGYVPEVAAHLGAYKSVDIALDTFPYNGTTTTCEALSMGVPVVVLEGRTHASRVGASLLHAAGLAEFIAEDVDAYVLLAMGLARDESRRRVLRLGLRERLRASALCDAGAYARRWEAALLRLWSSKDHKG